MKAVVVVLLLAASARAGIGQDCETARCAVQSTVEQRCPCAAAVTHGAYVRCVAQVLKELAADATIPVHCKGSIKRCAARSTCGRGAGAVTCDIPKVPGTCAVGLGFCIHPDGSILYAHSCASDADCVIESRCRISASAERCTAQGGAVASRASCCTQCGTPCAPGVTCGSSEICVIFGPFGPGAFSQTCQPVPAGCELDRTCGCVSDALCPSPNVCRDLDAPGDRILCECAACV